MCLLRYIGRVYLEWGEVVFCGGWITLLERVLGGGLGGIGSRFGFVINI